MYNFKKCTRRLTSFLLVAFLIAESFSIPAFAASFPNLPENAENTTSVNLEEESTFVLANSDIQLSDDYIPESEYVSEIEASKWEPTNTSDELPEEFVAKSTVGDPMVYLTQKWLNQEYGDVPGFGSVPENGRTGWDTIYGLTRALQHELGIKQLANNFGPSTQKLYSKAPLHRQDGVKDRKFAILQGALWCKGYSPGYYLHENADGSVAFDEVFNADVERAVIELKKDAGMINPDGVVTVNVMKALMSMDAFKLLTSYGGDSKVRAMQQKLNRKYEAYTGLTPCDGVYGRNTNKAIVLALQAEEGLPTNVANGNFGNTTKRCCPQIPYVKNSNAAKSYSNRYYSASQISAMTELVQFALYVNGYGDGVTDGVFDADTKQAIRAFQQKYAIPITGIADKTTWLSLFISCGDTSRPAKAADCATQLSAAQAKSLYDNGYRYIGRYLTGRYSGGDKSISRAEAQRIFDAGLNFFPIYQTTARSNSYFTEKQGTIDAKAAIDAAAKLGIPRNTIIYFAVDFDCMDYQITSNIIPYFRAVHETMVGSIYRTGIYGTRNACSRVSKLGYACSSFVGDMSTGFSGNLGYSMPDNWAFDQFKTVTIGNGAGTLEIDKDGFSGRDYGVSKLDAPKDKTERPNITFGNPFGMDLNGPVVDILGHKTPLFKTPFGLDINLKDSIESEYDLKKNTYKVTIGLLESQSDPALKSKNYAEIKEMVQFFGGHTTTATWNKYQKLSSKLKKLPFKLGFSFDGSFAGYMEVDADSGAVREGGLIIIAKSKVSTNLPVYPPLVLKFTISGSLKGTLSFTQVNTNTFTPGGSLKFTVGLKAGLGVDVVIANAFAGGSGNINCSLNGKFTESFDTSFKATLDLNTHVELGVLLWGKSFDWKFAEWDLYPRKSTAQTPLYSISRDDLDFIEPLSPINMYSDNPDAFKANVQTYCFPKIICLGNNKMLMTYIDDIPNRSAENRTTLMYSVYDGTNWSTAAPVLDDGTVDCEPVICPDGNGGAHILWQNAKKIFAPNVTMDEMAANMELYYTHWNGNTFERTVALTNNNNYEMGYKIALSGNDVSVIWQQNSANDPFAVDGVNTIYRKQYKNNAWQNTETIATNLHIITSMDTAYQDGKNVIAFNAKSNTDLATTTDLELYYYNDSLVRLTNDNIPDFSACFIDNELYWISNSAVYTILNGDINSKSVAIENLDPSVSKIKALKNSNGQKSLVWEQADDDTVKLYGSFYNPVTGKFGASSPLSSGDDVIRVWDACMLSDGKVELAYASAQMLNAPASGEKPYGQLDLIQKSADEFFDISMSPIVTYNEETLPGKEITLSADLYNAGSKDVNQFDVSIIAPDGSIVHSDTITKKLLAGESCTLNVPFTLPSTNPKVAYTLKIMPHNGNDIAIENNQTVFTVGYADLAIDKVTESHTAKGRQLDIIIANHGYAPGSGTFKLTENNTPLNSYSIQLNPGETINITYNIDKNRLDSSVSENPILLNMNIESTSDENNYKNNTQEYYVYPDYSVEVTTATGGTVIGTGTYSYNSSATLIATPAPGYIFAGWFENGKLLDGLTSEYTFTVLSNRNIEARFIPNNLKISDIEIFGVLQVGSNITFTAEADGGTQPYQWAFHIYKGEKVCYSENNSSEHFFEWSPTESGNYTVVADLVDKSGFKVSYTKQFVIV